MDRIEETKALRNDENTHYNCCQSILIPCYDLCGMDRDTAGRMGAHFGSGMRHGGTCGAITGALMVLGLAGADEAQSKTLISRFQEKHGCLDCAHLLAAAASNGIARKPHCDNLVLEAVATIQELLDA